MSPARALCVLLLLLAACRSTPKGELDPARAAALEVEVRGVLATIPADLAREGPLAWLRHFARDGSFWMASDGRLAFPTLAVAEDVVRGFAPQVARMELEWPTPRVELLAPDLAAFGADYDERILAPDGAETRYRGYVTGLLTRTPEGWRLRHLHWSMLPPDPDER